MLKAKVVLGTALHGGKDLLVALPSYDGHVPTMWDPRPFGFGVTVGTSVLTDDGCYPLLFSPP